MRSYLFLYLLMEQKFLGLVMMWLVDKLVARDVRWRPIREYWWGCASCVGMETIVCLIPFWCSFLFCFSFLLWENGHSIFCLNSHIFRWRILNWYYALFSFSFFLLSLCIAVWWVMIELPVPCGSLMAVSLSCVFCKIVNFRCHMDE